MQWQQKLVKVFTSYPVVSTLFLPSATRLRTNDDYEIYNKLADTHVINMNISIMYLSLCEDT